MIRISMTRINSGERYNFPDREEDPIPALRMLVQCELAFGGDITEVTATRLTVVTRVLACVDTSIFEGSAEEMRVLHETAYYYLQACQDQDAVLEGVLADLERMPRGQGRIPLIINMAAPMLIGQNRLLLAAMRALGITEESDIYAGILMGLDDLFPAYELMQENPGMSLADVSVALG